MAYNETSKKAAYKYKAKSIKRVPFDMQIGDYEKLKEAAESQGVGVNTYIKNALAAYGSEKRPTLYLGENTVKALEKMAMNGESPLQCAARLLKQAIQKESK